MKIAEEFARHGSKLLTRYAKEWNLKRSDIEKTTAQLVSDRALSIRIGRFLPDWKLLLFLYGKGILADQSSIVRKAEIQDILKGDRTPRMTEALERLTTIVEKGEYPSKLSIKGLSLFDDFVEDHPEWKDPASSFVAFRDHPKLRGKPHALVERFQNSGLCYMHAGVVLQHYLVAMNNDEKVPMLNVGEYLKKYMPSEILYAHIWNNSGSDSLLFLESILKNSPLEGDMESRFHANSLRHDDLDVLLKEYGPGLVSGFVVDKDFSVTSWQHLGKRTGKIEGRHAMVLVGRRDAEDGKKRYLLQNWWKGKPYVEVDIDYLLSSKAIVHFIKAPQLEMGDYPTSMEALVECESGLDASENFTPET